MGELSAETLKYRGIRGYIVDGGTRDSTFIRNLEWPLFFRYFSPKDVVGRWTVGSTAEHIENGWVNRGTHRNQWRDDQYRRLRNRRH